MALVVSGHATPLGHAVHAVAEPIHGEEGGRIELKDKVDKGKERQKTVKNT